MRHKLEVSYASRAFKFATTVLALCVCFAIFAVGCSQSGTGGTGSAGGGSGTLKVGVRSDIIGFSYLNEHTGNYYGLEIDIAEELASRLGYANVEYTSVDPDNRKEKLMNGDVDCLIACYSISESREENFDFSPEYYTDSIVAMVENSSLITTTQDLSDTTIGTMGGSNAAPQLKQYLIDAGITDGAAITWNDDNSDVTFDHFHLLQFESYKELSDALEEGIVDAAVMDGSIAKTYMKDNRSLIEGFEIGEQKYGVATQKDSALSDEVAAAIQEMLDDGTIATLVDKWN